MKISYHSPHQPKCGVCQKHCKSYESLRNHLTGIILFHVVIVLSVKVYSLSLSLFSMFSSNYLGPLSRASCSRTFSAQGCDLCLKLYDNPSSLVKHREICPLSAPASLVSCWLVNSYVEIVTCLSFSGFHFIVHFKWLITKSHVIHFPFFHREQRYCLLQDLLMKSTPPKMPKPLLSTV